MKTCKECNNQVFGGGYCAYHQYIRRMKNGDLFKRKTRKNIIIPKESPKRKIEHKYYSDLCKELEMEIREKNNGNIYCYFSDEKIEGFVTWRHLKGRTGNFYIDKEWLKPVINERHNEYHFKPASWLLQQLWYKNLLEKFKKLDTQLYHKELNRIRKSESQLKFDE